MIVKFDKIIFIIFQDRGWALQSERQSWYNETVQALERANQAS